jgi:hypothetical protein
VTQVKVKPPFKTDRFDAIPFLPRFPNLDGDLSDWGSVRPLQLNRRYCPPYAQSKDPFPVYAAWNYQGFFFGYHVTQPQKFFSPATQYERAADGISLQKKRSGHNSWVLIADHFQVCIDTLDSRLGFRGDPHTQEFYVLPFGTVNDPHLPGMERFFQNRKYAQQRVGNGGWPYSRCSFNIFPPQPSEGPDGSGPYRVARRTKDGYTVEIFMPRTIFKQPVFAPGWYIGFNCMVRIGGDCGHYFRDSAAHWDSKFHIDSPASWGDLLMLGTDPDVRIQNVDSEWARSQAVIPGHSYLVTIIDPDRNINLASQDTVLLSVEVVPPEGKKGIPPGDTEVYILKETKKNSSTFRGFINTQPGFGGLVHGILEVQPGMQVRFAYVDFADAKGRRNVVYEQKLPVVSPIMKNVAKK